MNNDRFDENQKIINYQDGQYILNPFLELNFTTNIRGMGKVKSDFEVSKSPLFVNFIGKWLEWLLTSNDPTTRQFLDDIFNAGIVINKTCVPNNIFFKCKLGRNNLTPLANLSKNYSLSDYQLNTQIFFQDTPQIPEPVLNINPRMLNYNVSCYSKDLPVVWVKSLRLDIFMPFWLESYERDILANLIAGKVVKEQISKTLFEKLVDAEIFISNKEQTKEYISEQEFLKENGYLVLRDVLNPIQISSLRSYYRELREKGYFMTGDRQVKNRDSMPYEPISHLILLQFAKVMSKITGQNIIPSYSFVTTYYSQAVLARHLDRDECLWNVSCVFDTEPDLEEKDVWPIYLEINGQVKEVKLNLGDIVIYSGSTIPHWRNALPENQTCSVMLFHFIEKK